MSPRSSEADPRITLRLAVSSDCRLILDFIKDLARYEKLSHEVTTDEQGLRRALFGDRRVAEVVIADFDGRPAGFALFFHNFSTFLGKNGIYLEDLFVTPELRGRGIGIQLLAFLARTAVARGCGRLEWSVLDWNESAIRVYRNIGARPMDEWTVFRLTGAELEALSARSRAEVVPSK